MSKRDLGRVIHDGITSSWSWWSTWWPFGLAWPATALLIVLGAWAGQALDSRVPLVIFFPFAAALCATLLHRSVLVGLAFLGQLPVYALVARAGVRRQRPRAAAAAVVLLHLAGITLGSPLFWGPSHAAFGRRLAEAAGPGAQDCGLVPLAAGRAAAINCARTALAEGRPFFVAFQVMGIDSTIYEGLASPAPGHATRILWDSDVSGGYNLVPLRRIHETACGAPGIDDVDAGSPISCGEHRHARTPG